MIKATYKYFGYIFIFRLKNEVMLVNLIDKVLNFYEKKKSDQISQLCRIYLLRIEHTYYKLDVNILRGITNQIKIKEDQIAHVENDEEGKPKTNEEVEEKQSEQDINDEKLMDRLCKFVYTNGTDRIRTRAMLCQIFHHAKHDRWYEARELMLISHLQETIQHSDILTQVSTKLE